MADAAIEALDRNPETELTLLVSKPPAAAVAERLLGPARSKPVVAALIGLDRPLDVAPGVTVCSTLEQGAAAALAVLGCPQPDPIGSIDAAVAMLTTALSPSRRRMVGLFSGEPWPTRRWSSPAATSGPCTPTHRWSRRGRCPVPPTPTCAWTWARRSSPAAGPIP